MKKALVAHFFPAFILFSYQNFGRRETCVFARSFNLFAVNFNSVVFRVPTFIVASRNMKYLLLLTVAIQIASNAYGLPLPAGQIVKYRVPSKYFTKPNVTEQGDSNSLYSFLSQIHYAGSSPAVTINTNEILSEDVSTKSDVIPERVEATTGSVANESPEVNFANLTHD